jgi:hypothetical protein
VDQFTKFLHVVTTMGWSVCPPTPLASCAECSALGQRTSSAAYPTSGTCACAGQQQSIRDRGYFGVFSATTKHHGFTFGKDDLLRRPPYLAHARSSSEMCLVYVTLAADIVENNCGDKKDGGYIRVMLMLVVFVVVKFVKYGRKRIRNSVRLLTFNLGVFTRLLHCMTQLCFVIEVIGPIFCQSIFSFSSAGI